MAALRGGGGRAWNTSGTPETETSTLCKNHDQTIMTPEYTFNVNMLDLGIEMPNLHCSGTVSSND